jgi:hypothetical protein
MHQMRKTDLTLLFTSNITEINGASKTITELKQLQTKHKANTN